MALRPESLDTPERGMDLEDRRPAVLRAAPDPVSEAEQEDSPADELRRLRLRIATARHVAPGPKGLHCRDCFARGRDAALKVIEGE